MNKKDLRELRKNFSLDSDLFVINNITTAFVDHDGSPRCINTVPPYKMDDGPLNRFMSILKGVLRGKIGATLHEYEFTDPVDGSDEIVTMIRSCVTTRLNESELVESLIEHISSNTPFGESYAIIIGHCTYTVYHKTSDDIKNEYDSDDYNFIAVAICPVTFQEQELIYNATDDAIEPKAVLDRIVSRKHTDGFLYPVFTNRSADVNHVLYSTGNAKIVNSEFVQDVLHCVTGISAESQKGIYRDLLHELFGQDLTYTVLIDLNDSLSQIVADHSNDAEPYVLDESTMKNVLWGIGASSEVKDKLKSVFPSVVGDSKLIVSNLTFSNLKLSGEFGKLTVSLSNADSVRFAEFCGEKVIQLNLSECHLCVNDHEISY